jgi:hypothetical protein
MPDGFPAACRDTEILQRYVQRGSLHRIPATATGGTEGGRQEVNRPSLSIGDTVRLCASPRGLTQYRGKLGEVKKITPSAVGDFCDVVFSIDDETGATMHVKDTPCCYFEKATGKKPQRSRLSLHEPKDTRTEKEIQADCTAWLQSLGYQVLGVGQYRSQAVCFKCTTRRKQSGDARPVRVFCSECHAPVFSPDTGSSEGYPDTSVRHPARWKRGTVLLMEWKRSSDAKRRAKQLELEAAGWSDIVCSRHEAALSIRRFEHEVLGIDTLHEIEREAMKQ